MRQVRMRHKLWPLNVWDDNFKSCSSVSACIIQHFSVSMLFCFSTSIQICFPVYNPCSYDNTSYQTKVWYVGELCFFVYYSENVLFQCKKCLFWKVNVPHWRTRTNITRARITFIKYMGCSFTYTRRFWHGCMKKQEIN